MRTPRFLLSILAITGAGVASCTVPSMPQAPDGAKFYAANCASCHGASGRGDGILAPIIDTKPEDLTVLTRENGGAFPRARALSYIYGDPEQGHLARVMPQFGDAMAHDTVPIEVDGVLTPTPRVLAGLRVYLESIQR